MARRLYCAAFVLAGLAAAAPLAAAQAAAQTPADAQTLRAAIDDLQKDFEARLSALERRLAAIEGGGERSPAPVPASASIAAVEPPSNASAAAVGAS